jgi:cell wall-associated NlpC family hydrolase
MASISHLGRRHARQARNRVKQAALLGLRNRASIHYTQAAGPRWQGINKGLESRRRQFPNYADCSSFATWCLWNALHVAFGLEDHVNGAHWKAGYTGTLLTHGKRVRFRKKRGDLVIYGHGFPGHHVAIYIGGGMVVSHGSEAGPLYLRWNYRPDVMQVRRYI